MDRISRRQVVRGAGAVATSAALGAPSVHAQNDRQTLRFIAEADLKVLDPIWTTAYIARNHGYLVYDTPFGTDETLQIKPQMVDRLHGYSVAVERAARRALSVQQSGSRALVAFG